MSSQRKLSTLTASNVRLVVFSVGTLILVSGIIFYYSSDDLLRYETSVLKDIIFFFLSVFLSYSVAIVLSRNEYKTELEKLGNISVRRVGRLSDNIRQIAKSIQNRDEQYADELFRIAKDADESTNDILLITELTESTTNTESVHCPHCGFRETITLSESAGASDRISCRNCKRPYNLHRVQHGIKIVGINSSGSRNSNGNTYPNNNSLLENNTTTQNKIHIDCPNNECTSTLHIKPQFGKKQIQCFECFEVIEFDFEKKSILEHNTGQPLGIGMTFPGLAEVGSVKCPKCGDDVQVGRFIIHNSSGQKIAKCYGCKSTLYTDSENN